MQLYDMHSHILPAFDDGAKTVEDSISLIESLKSQGVTNICLTPHFYTNERSLERFLEKRARAFERFKPYIPDDVNLVLGTEVYVTSYLFNSDDLSQITYGKSNYILTEFPYSMQFNEKDMHMAIMCGMSGLFSALFGTPVTAAIFAMEVISVGIMYYSSFVPCMVSALTAFWVTGMFGLEPVEYVIKKIPSLELPNVLLTAVIGVGCALVSILFCLALEWTHKFAARFFKNEYLRLTVGGTAIVIMTFFIGTRYSGSGTDIIDQALGGGDVLPYDFVLKIIFTAITIGFGYKGGEIVPTLFIGATFGSLVGGLIGLPPAFSAAVGMIALFCAVVNCPIASIILSIEIFGSQGIVLFAIAVCISFMLSGYYGLYTGQKIIYSKRRTRFINRNVK